MASHDNFPEDSNVKDSNATHQRASQGLRILKPIYREILADLETPITAYLKVAETPSFLLESVEQGERVARYSFIGSGQRMRFEVWDNTVILMQDGEVKEFQSDDPLRNLWDLVVQPCYDDPNLPPFWAGAVGYSSYDLIRLYENLPDDNPDELNIPDLLFVQPEALMVFDHTKRKVMIVAAAVEDDAEDIARAERAIDALQQKMRKMRSTLPKNRSNKPMQWQSNFSKEGFLEAVQQSVAYIEAGDIFQVVPSQRISADCTIHPFSFYRALRMVNPSPYLGYLDFGKITLVASSPESLIRSQDGHYVETLPIAGTRKRGGHPQEDAALATELLADEKERAEHIMLVDLGRNDLGRVCEYGTVHVPDLMRVERFSHVMHLVSTVAGTLKGDKTPLDALAATLPMGTASGAPKIRAMEIIDELEPIRRGAYGGAFGYISVNGAMDMALTIRTAVVVDDRIHLQAGVGVVADSQPEAEYQESLNKLAALVKAAELASKGLE